MSAERCGDSVGTILESALNRGYVDELIISYKAFKLLKKIQSKLPNFYPLCETEIWWKAHSLGLISDDWMSRTKKGKKSPGYEHWGKRPSKGIVSPGKYAKKLTHRLERIEGK